MLRRNAEKGSTEIILMCLHSIAEEKQANLKNVLVTVFSLR